MEETIDAHQTCLMARLPRLDLAHVPQHIVQRGNSWLPCFLDDSDRLRYLQLLREAMLSTDVRLHAYVLIDNHVQLLATPSAAGDIGRMTQLTGSGSLLDRAQGLSRLRERTQSDSAHPAQIMRSPCTWEPRHEH